MKTEVMLTSKQITIDDLRNTDHVGFVVNEYGKGYISPNERYKLFATSLTNNDTFEKTPTSTFGCSAYNDIKGIINYVDREWKIVNLYRFDTRRELYQWLAE